MARGCDQASTASSALMAMAGVHVRAGLYFVVTSVARSYTGGPKIGLDLRHSGQGANADVPRIVRPCTIGG